jgi:hypothetical protein
VLKSSLALSGGPVIGRADNQIGGSQHVDCIVFRIAASGGVYVGGKARGENLEY